ncbi:Short-chain dehydrogenase/reductase SDR [Cinnamomum micranthum f. kanehirae]|uniref:Short-chain dehydrogenase/reductase SDR n=1 Tax=Cinnamomum micranthum f. kanehirae TaxID=337451 RepID=A0A3S3P0H6_9MAGN|nr:Short-chain dehydrogenase/reductase SDR [Cinnamomum micranthum f. kanehirae]
MKKAEECLAVNYYGCKGVTEALIPLSSIVQFSRIVNVSSEMGRLSLSPMKALKKCLVPPDGLTEEKVDEVLQWFSKGLQG